MKPRKAVNLSFISHFALDNLLYSLLVICVRSISVIVFLTPNVPIHLQAKFEVQFKDKKLFKSSHVNFGGQLSEFPPSVTGRQEIETMVKC